MIFMLPIPYVWRLSKLRARQRLGIMVIFGLGFIVCVVALLQIPFIKRREDSTTYFGTSVNILIAIQISFAIIAASLPDLRALIARVVPNFSPLHHRSLTTAGRGNNGQAGVLDEERASPTGDMHEDPRNVLEGKRVFRKPDWLRNDVPTSLMSTMITQTEITHLSRGCSQEQVPQLPHVPERAVAR
jgi:hypothetical protein